MHKVVWLVVVAAPQPPLPAWQQELLAQRGNPRVSVHRGGLPEHDELREAGAAIGLRPSLQMPVVVGMTTTPTRLPHIEPAVVSLLNQTQPVIVVINIPDVYTDRRGHWRNKKASIPAWLSELADERLIVHRVPTDWGPATKLVGTAIAAKNGLLRVDVERTVVVAADDDHEWEPYALATLVGHGFNTNDSAVWTYFAYDYPPSRSTAARLCVAQAGDLLATRLKFLVDLDTWSDELLAPHGRLQPCFFVDDLFFAAYLASRSARVYNHPWKYWLFKEAQKRTTNPAPCKKACSPVRFRLRYPDGLAMGPPRDRHSRNCMTNLVDLGWWPRQDTACHFDKRLPT